ncbi:hypothetical protein [Micromonospora coxensis]|nr:hypothetical protein [Micromonospora coxensis]
MVGLITNVASEQQQWPGWLALMQRYPWQSLGLFAAVAVALASYPIASPP